MQIQESTYYKIDFLFNVFSHKDKELFLDSLDVIRECRDELGELLLTACSTEEHIVDCKGKIITGYVVHYYLHLTYVREKWCCEDRIPHIDKITSAGILPLLLKENTSVTSMFGLFAIIKHLFTAGNLFQMARAIGIYDEIEMPILEELNCGDFDCRMSNRSIRYEELNIALIPAFFEYMDILLARSEEEVIDGLLGYNYNLSKFIGLEDEVMQNVIYISTMLADNFYFFERALSLIWFSEYAKSYKLEVYKQIKKAFESFDGRRFIFVSKETEQKIIKRHSPEVIFSFEKELGGN